LRLCLSAVIRETGYEIGSGPVLKVATWNVNGIRARAPEALQWIERESPDVVCLQEIKASPEHVPVPLCDLSGYWCFWHGHKGYSGVSLHLRKSTFPGRPRFVHPEFDHETRIVTARAGGFLFASAYVPNGGKDYPAKVRFLEAMDRWAAAEQVHCEGSPRRRGTGVAAEWAEASTRTELKPARTRACRSLRGEPHDRHDL